MNTLVSRLHKAYDANAETFEALVQVRIDLWNELSMEVQEEGPDCPHPTLENAVKVLDYLLLQDSGWQDNPPGYLLRELAGMEVSDGILEQATTAVCTKHGWKQLESGHVPR